MNVFDRVTINSDIYRKLGVLHGMCGTILYKRDFESYMVIIEQDHNGKTLDTPIDVIVKEKYIQLIDN